MTFAELLRPKGASLTTSAELAAATERAEAAVVSAGELLTRLTAQRSAALLSDDEPALDKIEAALVRAQRDADRAELAVGELRRRHEEALAAERQARLDAIHEGRKGPGRGAGAGPREVPEVGPSLGPIGGSALGA